MEEKIEIWQVGNTGLRNPNRIQEGFKAFANSPYVGNLRKENEIDFKMDTRNISGNTKELKYYKCIFSPSVICVYPVIGLAMVAFEIAQKFV